MTGAPAPYSVTHGFTLKSRWLTAAVLHRRKPFENRSQEWKQGWYAVHTGVAKDGDAWAEPHVRESCATDADVALIAADIAADRVPKGCIAGVCHVAHCLPPSSCRGSPWALGPVCMVIDQTLWLETPIAHAGQLGTWPLSHLAQARIHSQVSRSAIGTARFSTDYPPDPRALVRMREQRREEKRKRKRGKDAQQPTLKLSRYAAAAAEV